MTCDKGYSVAGVPGFLSNQQRSMDSRWVLLPFYSFIHTVEGWPGDERFIEGDMAEETAAGPLPVPAPVALRRKKWLSGGIELHIQGVMLLLWVTHGALLRKDRKLVGDYFSYK